ncbi:carboxylesterase/lipase family protein [Nonomuraea africana]|uniref:Carboxylic ester hydrolase n=1 Tax=Nonomuraea africana TaxID=46171 RepID=A0ABR9KG63_9ACTN|nr:carboxylesterase family protein [Nonomuraea africana]MBE1561002.1 para-nitrobenzyl esterase [Nonomuraea africana]
MIVKTAAGRVSGTRVDGVHAFLGVPFAAPPFGERRFRPPAPPEPWEGVRPAVEHGPAAPQLPAQDIGLFAPDVFRPGADCLNLDVYTPDLGVAGLPVLVWIHGGGFSTGANSAAWQRGHRFARDGVVFVAANYRLGFEGFLALDDAPANLGVLDWLAALRWVRANIAAFGGNPADVTLAGHSAGGAAVVTLMTMPDAAGLFRRSIVMSGSATLVAPLAEARAHAKELAARLGVRPLREDFAALPPERLLAEQPPPMTGQLDSLGESVPIKPVVDGEVVPGVPLEAIGTGIGGHLRLLAGCTSQEADVFVRRMVEGIDAGTARGAAEGLGFPYDPELPPAELVARAVTHHLFTRETRLLLRARSAAIAPTYAYEFRWESPVESPAGGGRVGAVHNLDLPFAFDVLDAPGVARTAGQGAPQALAREMHGAWVRFVRDGDPGWPAGVKRILR